MNESDPSGGSNLQKRVLINMRIIWLALLIGQLMFLLILVLLILPNQHVVHPQPILATVAFILTAAVIPAAFVARMMIFRRTRADGRMAPATYFTGSIIFWGGCESVTFFGLIVAMINGNLWPTIIVVAIALALFALTIPMADRISDGSNS